MGVNARADNTLRASDLDSGSVVIRLKTGDSERGDRYPIVLKSLCSRADLTLCSPSGYGESHNAAAYLATFLGLPRVDATTEHESVPQPERVAETFHERVRSQTKSVGPLPRPVSLRSQVEQSDGTVRVFIPGPDIKMTAPRGLIVPVVILLLECKLSHFLKQILSSLSCRSQPPEPGHDGSCGIPEHREEVAGRSRNDEQVPDEVAVAESLGRKESHAGRVRKASCEEPQNARQGHLGQEGSDGDDDEPPHGKIETRRKARVPDGSRQLQCQADNSQAPHQAE